MITTASVYFALRGADVTALDLSSKMVDLTLRLGKRFGKKITGVHSPAETPPFEEDCFDYVYLGNILHHIKDRSTLLKNIHRILKPGGRIFSWDPLAYNPIINIYRRLATEVRTEDESPLTRKDLLLYEKCFSHVGHREYWLTTLTLFIKYYLIDRIDPNKERYWKKILKEEESALGWFKALQGLDAFLTRLPFVNWLCWNTVIWGTKLSK